VDVAFDPRKSARNALERGLPFERARDFGFETATYIVDDRKDYGEARWIAVGYLDRRLHILCFVGMPTGIRIISFRKANRREANRYDQPQTVD
jgi:uncharacterized protein